MSVGVLLVLFGSCVGPTGAVRSKAPPPPIEAELPPPIAQMPPVQAPAPPAADVPQLTPFLTPFPCLNEDGSKLAILGHTITDETVGAERHSVLIFDVPALEDSHEALPSDSIVWWENAERFPTPPSEEVRRRLVEESQEAAAKLTSLGFARPVEVDSSSELRRQGDAHVTVWKLPPFTITEERTGARLTVRRGQRVVRRLETRSAPQLEGQCLAVSNQLFVTPGGDRWLIVTTLAAPPELYCPEEPRLSVVSAPR